MSRQVPFQAITCRALTGKASAAKRFDVERATKMSALIVAVQKRLVFDVSSLG